MYLQIHRRCVENIENDGTKNQKNILFSVKATDHLESELFVQSVHDGSTFRKPQLNDYWSKNIGIIDKLFQPGIVKF